MKRNAIALLAAMVGIASSVSLWGVTQPKVGTIDYIEGEVTLTRAGKVIKDPNIDDQLLSGDLIKTAGDGMLIIAFVKSTGMNGTLTVTPRTSLYLKLETVKGQPKTTIDLIAGSLGSKVAKIVGSPTMSVQTSGALMGIRGTEYEVAVSVNDSVLVTCVEGHVVCYDGTEEMPVPAGKVLEKRPGERLRYLPVAVSSVGQFRARWQADEIAAFRADASRALADYEKRYSKLAAQFQKEFAPFQNSPVLKKWPDEDRAGTKVNPNDPSNLREKKEIAGLLIPLRKTLFMFERIYYRVDELINLVEGSSLEKNELRAGLTAGDFLRRVRSEAELLARQTALYRYAESLYAERNPAGEFFGVEDDFFGTSDF